MLPFQNPQFGDPIAGPAPQINPFAMPQTMDFEAGQAPPSPPEAAPTADGKPGPIANYVQGWKSFIGRFKTDPDLRTAMLQTLIGVAAPAPNAAAGISQGLNAGVQTLQHLKDQHTQEQRQAAQDALAARKVTNEEAQTALQGQSLAERSKEFAASTEQQRKELEAKWADIHSSEAYRTMEGSAALIRANKEGSNGEAGQVNNRVKMVQDAMLQDPSPALLAVPEGPQREARARVMAFDYVTKPGQEREAFVAKTLADMSVFLPDPQKKPAEYAKALQQNIQQANSYADAAGFGDRRITPQNAPAPPATSTGGVVAPGQPAGGPLPARPPAAAPAPAPAAPPATGSQPSTAKAPPGMPSFTDPNDPAFIALPAGTPFFDATIGIVRKK